MLETTNTTVICIDLQEKLVNMLENKDRILKNCTTFLKACSILNINTVLTEQYPKGLGSTIKAIKNIENFKTIEKTSFSASKTDEFSDYFEKVKNKNIIIFGIETHICVYQSVLDLLKQGFNVYILKDCCASRSIDNYQTSLNLMEKEGAKITTIEIVLFELLKSSRHEKFKEIQSLIK